MCLLFETIRIADGVPCHLEWHRQRMQEARAHFFPGGEELLPERLIRVPDEFRTGLVRCNIIYRRKVEDVLFSRYEKRIARTLKLVYDDAAEYAFKFRDRTQLDRLFQLRGECDEIIIVKNGLITDSSIANLIFSDGQRWFTPASPLLNGTCRRRLIASGQVTERAIRPDDLDRYIGCKLINAMRWPEEEAMINIRNISR